MYRERDARGGAVEITLRTNGGTNKPTTWTERQKDIEIARKRWMKRREWYLGEMR